jgi:hypothetical protein
MEQYNGMRDLNSLVEFVTMMKAKAASGPGAEAPKAEAPPDNVVPSGKPQLADSAPAHERTDEEQKDQQFLTDSNAGQVSYRVLKFLSIQCWIFSSEFVVFVVT